MPFKTICIFGSGGFAKEVYWLARECNHKVSAFIDLQDGPDVYGVPVKTEDYFDPQQHLAVVAVGNPKLRKKIAENIISKYGEDVFATLIAPSANLIADDINVGIGSVICQNCILTCNINLGKFTQLNLSTTIGHDVTASDYFTTAPGVHISGHVETGECVYFGTNSVSIEQIKICDNVTIGASACVTKDILESGVYIGTPAKKMERKNG